MESVDDSTSSQGRLLPIQEDLSAIRECLMRAGPGDARELSERLRSVVDQFRHWTSEGAVEKESVIEIQRELAELQPLFENAYTLHSGWFALADPAGNQYNGSGQRVGFAEMPFEQAVRG